MKLMTRYTGHISRTMRLAYLSPEVMERLMSLRDPPSRSLIDLIDAANLPWAEHIKRVFP
jgi:hypothetical protein